MMPDAFREVERTLQIYNITIRSPAGKVKRRGSRDVGPVDVSSTVQKTKHRLSGHNIFTLNILYWGKRIQKVLSTTLSASSLETAQEGNLLLFTITLRHNCKSIKQIEIANLFFLLLKCSVWLETQTEALRSHTAPNGI